MVKVAIFHEGNSKQTNDNALLKLLLEKLELPTNRVRFVAMGNKSNFFKTDNENYKQLIKDIQLEEISKILFVVDADSVENDALYGGFENTQTKLREIIDQLGIGNISDMYIMCDPETQNGYLESFILSTIPDEQKECIDAFMDCSDFGPRENDKAILNQIYKIAYPNEPFDLSHPNFNELKTKLQTLFEG